MNLLYVGLLTALLYSLSVGASTNVDLPSTGRWLCLDRVTNAAYGVSVSIDQDDLVIKGLSLLYPEAETRGFINGDEAVFASGQTLDPSESSTTRVFLSGGSIETVEDEWGRPLLRPDVEDEYRFTLASDRLSMASETTLMTLQGSENGIELLGYCERPEIFFQEEIDDYVPCKPEIMGWSEFNPAFGYAAIRFEIPAVNSAAQYLDSNNLSYRMLINGKPYMFQPATKPLPDDAPVTEWIPFNYSDYDLLVEGRSRYLIFYVDGTNNLGIQSRYSDPVTGEVWLSPVVDNGVEEVREVSGEGEVIEMESEEWYDFFGKRRSVGEKGPGLRIERFKDGSIRVLKVIGGVR